MHFYRYVPMAQNYYFLSRIGQFRSTHVLEYMFIHMCAILMCVSSSYWTGFLCVGTWPSRTLGLFCFHRSLKSPFTPIRVANMKKSNCIANELRSSHPFYTDNEICKSYWLDSADSNMSYGTSIIASIPFSTFTFSTSIIFRLVIVLGTNYKVDNRFQDFESMLSVFLTLMHTDSH